MKYSRHLREQDIELQPLPCGVRGNLYGWCCRPVAAERRGTLILVHGLGEHSGRYLELAKALAASGYATIAFDQQGHGQSPGRRGMSRGYDSMLADIDATCDAVRTAGMDGPMFLLGNSMGGNLAASYVLRGPHRFAGLILVAPMLLPAKTIKRDQILAAWITGKLLPFFRIRSTVPPERLTHDPEEIARMEADPWLHNRLSLRLGTELLAQGRWVLDHARELKLPLLVLHGEEDHAIELSAAQALCMKAGPLAKLIQLEAMYHDILHELERHRAIEHICQWMTSQLPQDIPLEQSSGEKHHGPK